MNKDFYKDVDSLKRELRRGRDYRIRVRDRKAPVTIVAPHGGLIEQGTSALANAVAGSEHNVFDFQGLRVSKPFQLHVTSHRFRDPALSKLLEQSQCAVSIHGMPDEFTASQVWLGGLNVELRSLIQSRLTGAGFSVVVEPPKYKGEHPDNFVNLPPLKGAQLELPLSLRRRMFDGKPFLRNGHRPKNNALFDSFVSAVRLAIAEYETRARLHD